MIDHTNAPPFYARGACSVCGAATFQEAETRCQTARDLGDDAVCSGGAADEYESSVPRDGFLYFVNPAYVAWMDAQLAVQGGETQP